MAAAAVFRSWMPFCYSTTVLNNLTVGTQSYDNQQQIHTQTKLKFEAHEVYIYISGDSYKHNLGTYICRTILLSVFHRVPDLQSTHKGTSDHTMT